MRERTARETCDAPSSYPHSVPHGAGGGAGPAGDNRSRRPGWRRRCGRYAAPPVTVYVANQGSGAVTPIRVATDRPGPAINTHGANSITATPDGRTVYAGHAGDTVTPVRTATNEAGRAVKVGGRPSTWWPRTR